nr:MAG TPA: cytidine deaminase-like protein [Caudoviricetes sp.]
MGMMTTIEPCALCTQLNRSHDEYGWNFPT